MSASGHELPPWLQFSVSALTPKADIGLDRKNVRFGPEADIGPGLNEGMSLEL